MPCSQHPGLRTLPSSQAPHLHPLHSTVSGSPPPSSSGYPSSITFDPIPPTHTAASLPTSSSHQHAAPPAAPSRERNLPRISEVDHGGHIPFNMGIHAGARRVPLSQLSPGPPSALPASEYHSPPSHPSEGASHHHSHSRAPPQAHVPTFIPPDPRRAAPVSFASHGPAHSTGYVPSTSTNNIPYDEDQTFKLNGTKKSFDAKSVPTFKPKKGLITYYKYSQTLNNLIATQGPRFDNCHAYLVWALVTHRHLSQPLPDEYRIWSANLKMGVSNSIDIVPPEEGVREFVERVLQVYDLFNMADPLMLAQELERYPTLHVFKAGLPEDYSPHITKILQELGVRTMDRDQQLMHIITKLQNYHEFVISGKHDNSWVTSTPGKSAHSSSTGHHTPSSPQAHETGYTRPLRRAFPATHVSMLDENVHDVPVHDSEYAYDTGTSNPQIPVDNDEQERVLSLQEELVEFYQDARRAKEFRPTSGPRHKQRGRPRNTAIPTAVITPKAPAFLLKRGPGRPKKIPTALVALMPTYKWSYPRAVEQGLSDLLPGISDPAFSKHISSFSPGGNRFKQHFNPVSAVELSTLLNLLDDSYSHSILDATHGAAVGVILHLPASESFSITTNEYLCDVPADFHLDPMQPESYTLIKEHHSMHIIIVCPALPLADILIPLASIYAQHVACCLISKKYFLNSYYGRYAWLISLRAEDRLYIIPSDSNNATDNVWMLIIFSSSGVKYSILKDSKDQLTGILLASSEYVLKS
ncbi:hypothetical protein CEUSTIGMA_g574.t1 [Chlamydomonas eustigma]|uniref:Uncharacterized protein n=1 Tax=Chlamydomonas eustigma TaxID=1157962 RepID=A0A250WQP6_9CHLO|nr:hypothetical protein CEUSTIGMA_g574.t1 [Chlamydomonas eustigma]|eukprot:GAX73121.1 hypothetical protein CEUSTIGMA_g574.t1 [Chlamydomonas eustigma]